MTKRQWRQLFAFLAILVSFSVTLLQSEPEPVVVVDGGYDADDWTVTRVADGDTFTAERQGEEVKVRMIGINTPESVDPRRGVECFGLEASDYMKTLLEGETVTLVEDSSQGSVDKYGRALRYVENDGVDVGLQLLEAGFAYEYTYSKPYDRQLVYKEAQHQAEIAGQGLWATDTCNGQK